MFRRKISRKQETKIDTYHSYCIHLIVIHPNNVLQYKFKNILFYL